MRVLLIDHFDSFTYNIKAWLREAKDYQLQLDIVPYGNEIDLGKYDFLILSPGPKSPSDYPLSLKLLAENKELPILGICLGMQMMVYVEGGEISPYSPPLHGKTSSLQIENNQLLFNDIKEMKVARYHSLVAKNLPSVFSMLASSPEQHPMAISHNEKKWLGVQFHPESFLTEQADILRRNILHWVKHE